MTCCITFFIINQVKCTTSVHQYFGSALLEHQLSESSCRLANQESGWNSRTQWILYCFIIIKDVVYGLVGIFLPWKLLLNGDIELLNHIISACQNCSVKNQS
ncbi:hypothetical protein TNCT_432831 [Trichonephila clavata]|uniref:Uncharacterized protein n=1 Tax=Trichonephila clavata TaxID=2740835 RepID=A0A8X6KYR7_TRICU|nr:hypothetical protein TNCT_432831 [Trichonephila clavata]